MDLAKPALAVAAPYAVLGVLEVLHDQAEVFTEPLDYVVELAFALSMTASVVAYLALRGCSAGLGRLAFGLSATGCLGVAVAALATAAAGREVLGPVLGIGLLGLVVGLLLALAADLRGRVVPRRSGVVLLLALLASIVLEPTGMGGLVLAAGWLGVARLAHASRPVDARA